MAWQHLQQLRQPNMWVPPLRLRLRQRQQQQQQSKQQIQQQIQQHRQHLRQEGSTAAVVSQNLFRTKLCKFYMDGRCRKGPLCTFAHSYEALQQPLSRSGRDYDEGAGNSEQALPTRMVLQDAAASTIKVPDDGIPSSVSTSIRNSSESSVRDIPSTTEDVRIVVRNTFITVEALASGSSRRASSAPPQLSAGLAQDLGSQRRSHGGPGGSPDASTPPARARGKPVDRTFGAPSLLQ
mmetsp:Transcript_93975/g.236805  ORF Transcript_93975/g.236805 Transcript_93975/m.236805 type:complete len:237 (+) Transcript_93975:279-989(+)